MFSIKPCFNAYSTRYVHVPTYARSFRNTRNSKVTISLIYFQRLQSRLPLFMYVTYWASAVKFFFDTFLRRCDFEMLFTLTLKILGLQYFSGTDHSEMENHRIYIYIYTHIYVPLFYSTLTLSWWKWGDSAGIQIFYGLDDWRFDPQWNMDFYLPQKPPRTALELTQAPPLCMAGRTVDIRPPTSTGVRAEQSYISTSPLCLHGIL